MNIKKVINEYNPFVILHRKKMRKALNNDNIPFFALIVSAVYFFMI